MGSGPDQRPKRAGIRNHNPGIWNHNAWDRDQQCFSWNQGSGWQQKRVQGSKCSSLSDQGSTFWVKIWDQLRKHIPRYDYETKHDWFFYAGCQLHSTSDRLDRLYRVGGVYWSCDATPDSVVPVVQANWQLWSYSDHHHFLFFPGLGLRTNVYRQDSSQACSRKELFFETAWHGRTHEAENIWPNTRASEQRNKGGAVESSNVIDFPCSLFAEHRLCYIFLQNIATYNSVCAKL